MLDLPPYVNSLVAALALLRYPSKHPDTADYCKSTVSLPSGGTSTLNAPGARTFAKDSIRGTGGTMLRAHRL